LLADILGVFLLCIAVAYVLGQFLVAMMKNLTGAILRYQFEVSVVLSVYQHLALNCLASLATRVWLYESFGNWLLEARTFVFEARTISGCVGVYGMGVGVARETAAVAAPHLPGRILGFVDHSTTIGTSNHMHTSRDVG
jgi:hypothetical protein